MTVRSRKPMIIAAVLFLVLIPAALLAARHPSSVQAEWFDTNWGFRTRMDLANSTGSTQTDFQVQIATDTATLVTAGKMLSNCNDLRFTDNHGKLLSHWIEPSTCNTSSTKVWVKVPSIPTGGTTIYMYYGNSNASAPPYKTTDVFIREIPNLKYVYDMDEASWNNNCSAGTVLDTSGNNYHAKSCPNTTGPTGGATGKYGNAGSLDGSVQYLDTNYSYSISYNTSFTYSVWINPTSISTGGKVKAIFGKTDFDTDLYQLDNKVNFQVWNSGGTNAFSIYANGNLTAGVWTQVTVSYDAATHKATLYLNGAYDNSQVATQNSFKASPETLKIGRGYGWGGSATPYFQGSIDNFRIYNGYALNQNEVADLFGTAGSNQGYVTTNYLGKELVRKYSSGISWANSYAEESGGGPIAYWKMDDGGGTTILDSSPNKYNGTLYSGVTWRDTSDCVAGKCLYFDGSSNAYATLGTSSRYGANSTQGAYTVEMWTKVDNTSKYNVATQHLGGYDYFSAGQPGTNKIYSMCHDNVNNVNSWPASNSTLSPNVWNHLVYVFNNRQYVKIYINGKLDNTISNTNLGFYNYGATSYLGIGNDANSYFRGFMDEVKVYAYERSATQIYDDYISPQNSSVNGQGVSIGSNTTLSPLNKGLVGWWKMDEATWSGTVADILDSSGNNATGTAQGTTGGKAYPTSGKFGNGGYFDGVDDYANMSNPNGNFNFGTGDFTLSAWIKTSDTVNSGRIIAKSAGGQALYQLFKNGTVAYFYIRDASSNISSALGTTNIANGGWHLITATKNATSVNLYVDGKLDKTNPNVTGSTDNTGALNIGAINASTLWSGYIDDARVYNRQLTTNEIQSLYSYAPGPYVYLPFDDGSGTAITDYSGNNYAGAWNGTGNHWTTGKFGKAGHFDGTDDWVSFASLPKPNNMPITLEFWTRPTTTAPVGIFDSGPGVGYTIRNYSAGRVEWWNAAPQVTLGLSANTWTHLAFVFDINDGRQNLNWYKNGVPQATASANGPLTWAWTTFRLGNINGGGAGWYSGDLDEFKIYNYARSSTQIVEDMNGGHPAGGSPIGSQAIYYKFNEGYGSTLNNAVSTNYTGTLYNNVTWENDGRFGKSLRFDGTTSQIVVNNSDNYFKYQGGDMTLSLWVKPDPADNGGDLISKPWNGSGQYNYRLTSTGGSAPSFNMALIGATSWSLPSSKTVTAGSWHHIAFTIQSNGAAKFFVDGVQTNSGVNTVTNWTPASGDSNLRLVIGCIYPYANNSCAGNTTLDYMGSMDEIKIYTTALTPQQIYMDYNAGASLNFGTGYASDSAAMSDGTGTPPALYWDFEEGSGTTANDKSGNTGGNGTLSGATKPTWTQGKIGKALSFNGTTAWVLGPNTAAVQNTSGTLEAWINTTNPGSSYRGILAKQLAYGMFLSSNEFGTYDWGASAWRGTGVNLNDGKWHHVVMTYQSGVSNGTLLYIDGVQKLATTITVSGQGVAFAVGAGSTAPSQLINGKIDEAKYYNYVRTPAQVAYDYNRGAPVAWYKFDECSGSTLNDATGNGNNGTWAGGTSIGSCTTPSTAWGNGVTGKFNSSLAFNSANSDYLSVSQTSGLPIYNNPIHSVSMWLKFGNLTQTAIWFICDGNSVSTNQVYCLGTGGSDAKKLRLYVRTDSGSVLLDQVTTNAVINDLNWHHVVLTDNNGTVTTYVDGVTQPFAASTYTRGTLTLNRTAIGALLRNTAQYFFNGQIDDVRIYNYALSQTQINNIYNGGAAVRYAPVTGTP